MPVNNILSLLCGITTKEAFRWFGIMSASTGAFAWYFAIRVSLPVHWTALALIAGGMVFYIGSYWIKKLAPAL